MTVDLSAAVCGRPVSLGRRTWTATEPLYGAKELFISTSASSLKFQKTFFSFTHEAEKHARPKMFLSFTKVLLSFIYKQKKMLLRLLEAPKAEAEA